MSNSNLTITSNHRQIIIDPASANIRFYVAGDTPILWQIPDTNYERSANGRLIVGTPPEFLDFEVEGYLEESEFFKLRSLYSSTIKRRSQGLNPDTVIYILAEEFTEPSGEQSRREVPGTPITIGYGYQRYYPALQGIFDLEWSQAGEGVFQVRFRFVESTNLLPTT